MVRLRSILSRMCTPVGLVVSFGVNKKVKKLDSFIETWCNDIYCKSIDYDEIATHGNEVMKKWNSNTAKELLTEHQMLVEDYFELIRENLRN